MITPSASCVFDDTRADKRASMDLKKRDDFEPPALPDLATT